MSMPDAPAAWRLSPGKELSLPTAVLAVDSDSASTHLFAACLDGGVYEVSRVSGERRQIGKHDSYASGVRYLPRLDQVVSAGYDGTLRWLDRAGKTVRTVAAHRFWSWKMRASADGRLVATVTGQYMAGGYKYEPAGEQEPSVKVFDAETGQLRGSFAHVPPVLSVAFSPDSRVVAAANLMGEIRVWDLESGKQAASWTTPDFTCWGIIKSHHYVGGIYDLEFSPDGKELLATGMGPMVDPMAGNGKQTWQRFAWQASPPKKVSEIREGEAGRGLMEVIRFHPGADAFLMAGKLAQGKWNVALFDSAAGALAHSADTKMRVTDAAWLDRGQVVALAGATGQGKKKDGKYADFGHIKLFDVKRAAG